MRGAPHKGLAWRMRRIRSRMFAATSGLPGKAARFPSPMPGESSAVPTEDRVGLNHLQTSPPTGPESRQHNSQESVAAVEAQATQGVLLEAPDPNSEIPETTYLLPFFNSLPCR